MHFPPLAVEDVPVHLEAEALVLHAVQRLDVVAVLETLFCAKQEIARVGGTRFRFAALNESSDSGEGAVVDAVRSTDTLALPKREVSPFGSCEGGKSM